MKEYLFYENHLGEKIEFRKNKYLYVNENALRDFVWNFNTDNGTITDFNKRGVITKPLTVTVAAPLSIATELKNELFEIFEKDVIARKNGNKKAIGKIWCGDYYYKCFIVGSSKGLYLKSKKITQFELTTASDEPIWFKEQSQIITPVVAAGGIDFPVEYPFDLENSFTQQTLLQDYFQPVDFRIKVDAVEKEIINPAVVIGANRYQVNVNVPVAHSLIIDSLTKEVYLISNTGLITNVLHHRNKEIFTKIAPGNQSISWDNENAFSFELTTYKERSEPEWI